jgi:SAM-dependent methyltransferase
VLTQTGLDPGAQILDLGCGPGRHSLELARRGFQVVGVDRTTAFWEEARQCSTQEELSVEWVLEDMRSFSRSESFDLCLSLFTSFGYFENPADNQQVLKNACDSLRSGGSLIIELMGKEVLARIFQEKDWYQVGNAYVLQERKPIDNWNKIWNRWVLIAADKQREFDVIHWVYSADELTTMLASSGFKDIQVQGDLAGSPYDHHASRLAIVASKRKNYL